MNPKSPVAVQVIGGLGNQMFQYAIGRRLAEERGTELYLDTSAFATYPLHGYALDKLRTRRSELSPAIHPRVRRLDPINAARRLIGSSSAINVVREKGFPFDNSVLKENGFLYLKGYWQSEKYFAPVAAALRDEFQPIAPIAPDDEDLAKQLRAANSVAVHIRRGDYVSNSHTNSVHGVMSLDYYREALAELLKRVPSPKLYLFSDDPEWVRQNFQVEQNFEVATRTGRNNVDEMRMMSLASHQIIANSTFSWWAAWLNANPEKTVIAPKKWFGDPSMSTVDLIPSGWLRV